MAQSERKEVKHNALLKKGDTVQIIAGGNSASKPLKGKTGKVIAIRGDRVTVEGLNMVRKYRRPTGPQSPGGMVTVEAALHISNVMYFAEKAKRPVKLKARTLQDGTKVRGYIDPSSKEFVQI